MRHRNPLSKGRKQRLPSTRRNQPLCHPQCLRTEAAAVESVKRLKWRTANVTSGHAPSALCRYTPTCNSSDAGCTERGERRGTKGKECQQDRTSPTPNGRSSTSIIRVRQMINLTTMGRWQGRGEKEERRVVCWRPRWRLNRVRPFLRTRRTWGPSLGAVMKSWMQAPE